jgi:ribosome-binding factor A
MAKSTTPAGRAPSQRQLRVSELIRHAIAELLQRGDIHDEVLERQIVTVPEVRLSPDLKMATVYIMPLGGKDEKPVLQALEKHRKFIRSFVSQRVNLKYAPELIFRRDETFDEADRITRLLRSKPVQRDLAPRAGSEGDGTAGDS